MARQGSFVIKRSLGEKQCLCAVKGGSVVGGFVAGEIREIGALEVPPPCCILGAGVPGARTEILKYTYSFV